MEEEKEGQMDFKIEPGKFYELRNGSKYRNYATDGCGHSPIHGALFRDDGTYWEPVEHSATGHYIEDVSSPLDIIAPWVEKPVVDWSALPKWMPWVVQILSGEWCCCEQEPFITAGYWDLRPRITYIPDSYAPKFTGPWQESKIKRPDNI